YTYSYAADGEYVYVYVYGLGAGNPRSSVFICGFSVLPPRRHVHGLVARQKDFARLEPARLADVGALRDVDGHATALACFGIARGECGGELRGRARETGMAVGVADHHV